MSVDSSIIAEGPASSTGTSFSTGTTELSLCPLFLGEYLSSSHGAFLDLRAFGVGFFAASGSACLVVDALVLDD